MNRLLPVLTFSILLTGCMPSMQKPAPVTLYGTSEGAGSAGVHEVVGNETLWNISQRYQLSMRDIAAANNLGPPFDLTPGQRLRLPPPREYKVHTGDSMATVSKLFSVPESDIAKLNHILPPYTLKEGQNIRLPTLTRDTDPVPVQLTQTETLIQRQKPPAPTIQRIPPSENKVIATPAPVKSEVLAGSPPKHIPMKVPSAQPGQPQHVLKLPPGYEERQGDIPVAQYDLNKKDLPAAEYDITSQPIQTVKAPDQPEKKTAITAKVPKRESSKFLKPVAGKIISNYGPKSDGLHNDGINIAAAPGTAVKAAENGVVVYAGDELKPSGNLIIIRHQDRWMTAYAHLGQITIKRGDTVKRGQTIGTVGSTGSVNKPQLHFEVRRGTEAINPKLYLEG